jgi:hypothetical protein
MAPHLEHLRETWRLARRKEELNLNPLETLVPEEFTLRAQERFHEMIEAALEGTPPVVLHPAGAKMTLVALQQSV